MKNDRPQHSGATQWTLVVTDDASFGRELSACWQARADVPEFTTVSSEGSELVGIERSLGLEGYDLVIIGHIVADEILPVVRRVQPTTALLVWTPPGMSPGVVREEAPDALVMRESEDLVESSVTIGAELLLHASCQKKLANTKRSSSDDKIHAALGRYMLDSRHSFSNALTSVLGTAELMQITDFHGDRLLEHLKTIHMGALRMQSLLQHFSLLEAEMRLKQRQTNGVAGGLTLLVGATEGRTQ